jgi:hypothetical protein
MCFFVFLGVFIFIWFFNVIFIIFADIFMIDIVRVYNLRGVIFDGFSGLFVETWFGCFLKGHIIGDINIDIGMGIKHFFFIL